MYFTPQTWKPGYAPGKT